MEKPFFVMIYDQHGSAMVMTDSSADPHFPPVAFFPTFEAADAVGKENLLAQACGHEVHCMGDDSCATLFAPEI